MTQEFVGLWSDKLLRQNRLQENGKKGLKRHEFDPTPVSYNGSTGVT